MRDASLLQVRGNNISFVFYDHHVYVTGQLVRVFLVSGLLDHHRA